MVCFGGLPIRVAKEWVEEAIPEDVEIIIEILSCEEGREEVFFPRCLSRYDIFRRLLSFYPILRARETSSVHKMAAEPSFKSLLHVLLIARDSSPTFKKRSSPFPFRRPLPHKTTPKF